MKINLYKDYWLTSDERNYILNILMKDVSRKGEKTDELEPIGYYRTIGGAIKGIIEREPRLTRISSYDGVEKEYIKLQKMVADLDDKLLKKYPEK